LRKQNGELHEKDSEPAYIVRKQGQTIEYNKSKEGRAGKNIVEKKEKKEAIVQDH